ncbi:DDE_3 domain-containing protein [Trichonephila clavipes]|nr:DDE_3 domain-containing protein [Trichonephila clavipes]
MDVGVYVVKPLKANTLQPLPERSRREHYGLGNFFLAFSGFSHHCRRHDGSIKDGGFDQQEKAKCHTAGSVLDWFEEHQDEFTVLPWPANSPYLSIIENLWGHLDRVVRTMDPHPRNLAQLATALESAWLNIPVNTFKNLIHSLSVGLAAVRSVKGGYSGFWQVVTLM